MIVFSIFLFLSHFLLYTPAATSVQHNLNGNNKRIIFINENHALVATEYSISKIIFFNNQRFHFIVESIECHEQYLFPTFRNKQPIIISLQASRKVSSGFVSLTIFHITFNKTKFYAIIIHTAQIIKSQQLSQAEEILDKFVQKGKIFKILLLKVYNHFISSCNFNCNIKEQMQLYSLKFFTFL